MEKEISKIEVHIVSTNRHVLFRQNYDNVLLRYLKKDDADKVLAKLHDRLVGKHFGGEMTAHKVLKVGYYWPTLFKDAHAYARECQVF